MKLKIYIDLDGVIYDWMSSALDVFKIDAKAADNRRILKTYHEGLEMIKSKKEVFNKIESLGASYWENLKLFPWANTLYESLTGLGEVTVLTSPGSWTYAGRGKMLALKRDFEIKNFILAKKKEVCAAPDCILIDDKKKNVTRFREAGGWAYLWPNSFCIEDGHPTQSGAIADCLEYVKAVRQKVIDRRIPLFMDMFAYDNQREQDLTER
jgi:5'(3')-deoxyribonucleotidase